MQGYWRNTRIERDGINIIFKKLVFWEESLLPGWPSPRQVFLELSSSRYILRQAVWLRGWQMFFGIFIVSRTQIKILHTSPMLNDCQPHFSVRTSASYVPMLTSIFIFSFMNSTWFFLLLYSSPNKANLLSWEGPCEAGVYLRSYDCSIL